METLAIVELIGPHLVHADRARDLFEIVNRLLDSESVELDFTGVLQMTPSFANNFFFNLRHQPASENRGALTWSNAAPHINDRIERAIRMSEIRSLSAYSTPQQI